MSFCFCYLACIALANTTGLVKVLCSTNVVKFNKGFVECFTLIEFDTIFRYSKVMNLSGNSVG